MIHPGLSHLCVFRMEEQKKKSVRSDNWIQANIVVKVITKKLGEKYYKKKAVIRVTAALSLQDTQRGSMFPTVMLCVISQEVQGKYTAVVKMIDSGDKLKLDQSHLETVIPAPGSTCYFLFFSVTQNEERKKFSI